MNTSPRFDMIKVLPETLTMKTAFPTLAVLCLASCTTASQYRRADGGTNVLVACGAGLGWNICLDRAKEECPTGFNVESQRAGFNRKEMMVSCTGPQVVSPQERVAAQCRMQARDGAGSISDSEHQSWIDDCMLAAGYRPDRQR
jgi:hypothetical protein